MLETTMGTPLLFFSLVALLGLLIGSFLNVVILRLPVMLQKDWFTQCQQFLSENYQIEVPAVEKAFPKTYNLITPRSHCSSCQTPIRMIDNIPIISFLLLRGKCHHCHHAISWRYPLVEFLTAVLTTVTAYHFGFSFALLGALIFTWALIVLTLIDLDKQILPDNITLPLLWLGLLFNIQNYYCPLSEAILGATIGYLSLWALYWVFKFLTGKEGMGYGDFKLLATIGAWVGFKLLLPVILISSFLGALIGLSLIALRKHKREAPIPFGPFLALGGWVTFLWGEQLLSFYFRISGFI